MLVSFEVVILNPELNCVENHWDYYHHTDELHVWVAFQSKRLQNPKADFQDDFVKCNFLAKHNDLGQEDTRRPHKNL